ncbi:MAG: DUF2800 domain-containing protein [Chloroflexi bacterium]|nr:DUF2800 domain-containing protein [Chloroflexota bacterium]
MGELVMVCGPAGSGKTGRLVDHAARRYQDDRFAPTLVLVPTARHGDQFRRRLVAACGVALSLDVSTLAQYARLHAAGRTLSRDVAADLLRRVAKDRIDSGEASRFAPIADKPGLHALIAEAVTELVAADIEPAAFAGAAAATESADLVALADIYAAYRRDLAKRGWHDPAEAPSLAAEAIAGAPGLPGLVLVDSFEFLNPREQSLIAALADHTRVLVAIDRGASERARWTAARLGALAGVATVEELPETDGIATTSAHRAFDAEVQLRGIARAIKQRLGEEEALRPSDVAVAFRQASQHLALARRVFAEYELPFDPAAGERLASRPFGTWVLALLRLPEHDWRLARLAELLRSAFLDRSRWGIEGDTVDHLLRVGRRQHLLSGLERLERLRGALADEAVRAAGAGRAGYAVRLRAAHDGLEQATEALSDLLGGEARTAGEWAQALDDALLGPGGLVRASVEGYESLEVEAAALRADLDALRAIDERFGGTPLTLEAFAAELERRMQRPAVLLREAGGVLFAPMHTLHGLRFAHVFLGGLAEGEFPAPRRAARLLDREARERLGEAGLALPPEPRSTEDELWRSASTRADGATSLWRPRFDDAGRPVPASWYFDEEEAADESAEVEPHDAASQRELAVTLSARWQRGERRRPADLAAWPVVRTAAPIEQQRSSFANAGRHEGDLTSAGSARERLVGPEVRWSATRIESYRTCAFQFFASYGLRLYEVEDELVEADAATRGTVIHDIMEAVLGPLAEAGRPLVPTTADEAIRRMREHGQELWLDAPRKYHFGRAALWRLDWKDTADNLERLIRREAEWNETFGTTAVHGIEARVDVALPGIEPELRLRGNIDRVDVGPDLAQIVDYKSGRAITRRSVERGERLQLQLYALASREQLAVERLIARYAYLDPRANEWALDSADPADAALIEDAARHAEVVRSSVAAGDFRVNPQVTPCPRYCDFKHICRVNQFTRWKQWS